METLPLGEVVYAAAQTMQYPFAEQGFMLGLTIIDDGIPPVLIDRDAILQAILNLLTNAMKYSGKSRKIELQLSTENGNAVVRVTDHGIGIPEDEQKRIFEKFYRHPFLKIRRSQVLELGWLWSRTSLKPTEEPSRCKASRVRQHFFNPSSH